MKFKEKMSKEKNQIYVLTSVMYIIGALCDLFGYINTGIEVVGFLFIFCSTIFSISLACMWSNNNTKVLKAAKIHLTFIIICIILLMLTYYVKMYFTFTGILCFTLVNVIVFIYDLFEIGSKYSDNKWD